MAALHHVTVVVADAAPLLEFLRAATDLPVAGVAEVAADAAGPTFEGVLAGTVTSTLLGEGRAGLLEVVEGTGPNEGPAFALSIETPDVESALALGRLHGEASDAVEVPYGGSTGLVGAVTVGGVRIQLTGPRRRVDKQDH